MILPRLLTNILGLYAIEQVYKTSSIFLNWQSTLQWLICLIGVTVKFGCKKFLHIPAS